MKHQSIKIHGVDGHGHNVANHTHMEHYGKSNAKHEFHPHSMQHNGEEHPACEREENEKEEREED